MSGRSDVRATAWPTRFTYRTSSGCSSVPPNRATTCKEMACPRDCSSSYPIGIRPPARVPRPPRMSPKREPPDFLSAAKLTLAHVATMAIALNVMITAIARLFRIFTKLPFLEEVFDFLIGNLIGGHTINCITIALGNPGTIGIFARDFIQTAGTCRRGRVGGLFPLEEAPGLGEFIVAAARWLYRRSLRGKNPARDA